jgi:hypothetical protein
VTLETNADSISTDAFVAFDAIHSTYAEIVYYNYNASDFSKDLIRFRILRIIKFIKPNKSFVYYSVLFSFISEYLRFSAQTG